LSEFFITDDISAKEMSDKQGERGATLVM